MCGAPSRHGSLPQDLEGAIAIAAVAIDRKIVVKACGAREAEAFHDGEARAVDDRKALIRERLADEPSPFEIERSDLLHCDGAAPDPDPELFGRLSGTRLLSNPQVSTRT